MGVHFQDYLELARPVWKIQTEGLRDWLCEQGVLEVEEIPDDAGFDTQEESDTASSCTLETNRYLDDPYRDEQVHTHEKPAGRAETEPITDAETAYDPAWILL